MFMLYAVQCPKKEYRHGENLLRKESYKTQIASSVIELGMFSPFVLIMSNEWMLSTDLILLDNIISCEAQVRSEDLPVSRGFTDEEHCLLSNDGVRERDAA